MIDLANASEDELVLTCAAMLFANGDDTSAVLSAADQLGRRLRRPLSVSIQWGQIQLIEHGKVIGTAPAVPYAINMRRVVGVRGGLDLADVDPHGLVALRGVLDRVTKLPAYGMGVFTLACALGAFALTILNGAQHLIVPTIAAAAAAAGALLRRALATRGGNPLAQLFAATLLAGGAAGCAAHLGVSFGSGLVALGPLFVLVPGPAFLGGTFDCAALRLPLGLARLTFGLLCVVVLCAGVLLGSGAIGGVIPTADPPPSTLPVWGDMLCAAVASATYAIFFVMPARMMLLPTLMGGVAHGVRWIALERWHWSNAAAAGLACLLVAIVVEPLARRWRLPFAAVGFASVVAQVPGVYLFRMSGGLVSLLHLGAAAPASLIASISSDGGNALFTIVAMALALTLPKSLIMNLSGSPHAP